MEETMRRFAPWVAVGLALYQLSRIVYLVITTK